MLSISYQLYSSRFYSPLSQTMQMLKNSGYSQVEGYGGLFRDLTTLRAGLDAFELSMPSAHFDLEMLRKDIDGVLEISTTLGMKHVYCPYLSPENRPDDAAGWQAFGRELQEIGKPLLDSGLTFGWHNHDFEMMRQADGSMPLDELFDAASDISWEIDIAWIVRSGSDPVDWINKYAQRISAVHCKDLAPVGECLDEDGWADLGYGIIDWSRICLELAKSRANLYVLEHDNPNDHQRFASRSISALEAFGEAINA